MHGAGAKRRCPGQRAGVEFIGLYVSADAYVLPAFQQMPELKVRAYGAAVLRGERAAYLRVVERPADFAPEGHPVAGEEPCEVELNPGRPAFDEFVQPFRSEGYVFYVVVRCHQNGIGYADDFSFCDSLDCVVRCVELEVLDLQVVDITVDIG